MAPRLQLTSVTIGAPDPRALAAFYARLLGTEVGHQDPPRPGEPAQAGWAQLRATSDYGRVTLNFEYERHYTAPTWPSEPDRQQIMEHLDIYVDDLDAAVEWAIECGARLADFQPQSDVRVLFDPAGHPFCLFV
ncbi:MAG TPA: VOC family protein [Nakamurella sp.]|nr:VOC family protein [Nakamurella sp.]